MSDASLSESTVEAATLAWLEGCGWAVANGPDVAPDTQNAARVDYSQVVLEERLRSAIARLNPSLPADALDDALRRLTHPAGAPLEARNRAFHRMVVDGVTVEYVDTDGAIHGAQVRVLDFDEPEANDWLAVNQVHGRREQARTPAGHRAVRQRAAAGRHRAEAPHRRERDDPVGVPASFRPTRRRFPRCSRATRCWSCRTDSRRASER